MFISASGKRPLSGITVRVALYAVMIGCCAVNLLVGGVGRAATRSADSGRPAAGPMASEVPPLGDPAVRPEVRDLSVLVVGDSWGVILGTGMAKLADLHKDRRNIVIKAARGGCGIMQPVRVHPRGALVATPMCNDWPESWRELVTRHQPAAVLLETGYLDTYIAQQLPGQDHVTTISDPVFRARYDSQVDRAIRVLSASGARVFLPTISNLATSSWDRYSSNWAVAMNAAVRAAVVRNPAARLLDMHGQMCTAENCPRVISGIPVYDETSHPTPAARDRLAAWILNSIYADLHPGQAPNARGTT
jgi:hypothetical protein